MKNEPTVPAVAGPLDVPVGLVDALGLYWQAAYAEGRENRTHDTEDGRAQSALEAVYAAVAAAVAAERERCAKLCESREPWSAPTDWWRIATKRDVSRHTAKHLAAAIRNT